MSLSGPAACGQQTEEGAEAHEEKKGLEWKEVAYLGETGALCFSELHQPNAMISNNMVYLRNVGVVNTGLKDCTWILPTNTKT